MRNERDTGLILEKVLTGNQVIKTRLEAGNYTNVPFILALIRDGSGLAIAAIGAVDVSGIFDLADLISHQSQIINEICYCAVPASRS
jgi:hypothetical protein